MKEYHKIQSVFLRDPETKFKRLLVGQYTHPVFAYLANNEWVFTEKVDGTNIRVMIGDGSITFGGKTDDAQIPAFLVRRLEERILPQKDTLLAAFPDGGCLYGEGYGAKIQKAGANYRTDQDFVLFDVKVGEWWLERTNVEDVAAKFGLDVVPIIGIGTLAEMVERTSEGFVSRWGSFLAEGIVARPSCELKTRNGERIITKIKHRDF
jgi:ATP-dependent RNA circularization protein (DNA/RNA ligase family)